MSRETLTKSVYRDGYTVQIAMIEVLGKVLEKVSGKLGVSSDTFS